MPTLLPTMLSSHNDKAGSRPRGTGLPTVTNGNGVGIRDKGAFEYFLANLLQMLNYLDDLTVDVHALRGRGATRFGHVKEAKTYFLLRHQPLRGSLWDAVVHLVGDRSCPAVGLLPPVIRLRVPVTTSEV